jgi:hypothetical protein
MPVKKLLGTASAEQKAGEECNTDHTHDRGQRIGPDGPGGFAGPSRRKLCDGDALVAHEAGSVVQPRFRDGTGPVSRTLGDGVAFVADEVGGVLQTRLGNRAGPFGELREMVLC